MSTFSSTRNVATWRLWCKCLHSPLLEILLPGGNGVDVYILYYQKCCYLWRLWCKCLHSPLLKILLPGGNGVDVYILLYQKILLPGGNCVDAYTLLYQKYYYPEAMVQMSTFSSTRNYFLEGKQQMSKLSSNKNITTWRESSRCLHSPLLDTYLPKGNGAYVYILLY